MKKLFILFLVGLFLFLSCTSEIQKTIEKEIIVKDGESWLKASNEKIQIYPVIPAVTLNERVKPFIEKILSNTFIYAAKPAPVTEIKARDDHDTKGIKYAENSFSPTNSWKHGEIDTMSVGDIVGTEQRMLVNVVFEVTDYQANANPIAIYIRAKGSSNSWTVLYPKLGIPATALVVTNDDGDLEWYADNTAPYDDIDPDLAEPDVHVYGYQTIVGYADGYCVFLTINN